MSIVNDLDELVSKHVISSEVADRIRGHYQQKTNESPNRLLIVFGILGALLVGLGIILVIAHNWDIFSKGTKLKFALLPLLIGQAAGIYYWLRLKNNVTWREASATFLFLAVGASISLISQIYHIEGTMEGFLFIWMIACLPIIYALNSNMAAMLFLVGITWYASEVSYFTYSLQRTAWWYWLFLGLMVPHYYSQLKQHPSGNFTTFLSWLLVISLTISLGMIGNKIEEWTMAAYVSMFCGFILLGELSPFSKNKLFKNPSRFVGNAGLAILLLITSFKWFWEEFTPNQNYTHPEFLLFGTLCLGTLALAIYSVNKLSWKNLDYKGLIFIPFFILFLVGNSIPLFTQICINVLVLGLAIFTISKGARTDSIGILNYGLLIFTALVFCRFFDTNMSFVLRGLLFILVGSSFFAANYFLIKKRKEDQKA